MFDHRKVGRLSGKFGFWGQHRDFASSGEEALAPPTKQNSFAVFGLENLDFERISFQFGGRLEHNHYTPTETPERGLLPERSFTGFSAAFGVRVPTWKGGAFVANYSHSYRAPSLEELYNNGPHPGNLAFEIGDPNLKRELGNGLDFGLRHSSKRLRFEANGFYYHIDDFVFLAPTGAIVDDLIRGGIPPGHYAVRWFGSQNGHRAASQSLAEPRDRLRQRGTYRHEYAIAPHSAIARARGSGDSI